MDKFMKDQLLKMAGSKVDISLELRKFPLIDGDSSNFESVNIEFLKALSTDKPVKLQKLNCHNTGLTKIELFFTNGLESASYKATSYSASQVKSEQTWDVSKQIKKISVKLYSNSVGTWLNGI